MSRSIFNCLKLCFLIVLCTADRRSAKIRHILRGSSEEHPDADVEGKGDSQLVASGYIDPGSAGEHQGGKSNGDKNDDSKGADNSKQHDSDANGDNNADSKGADNSEQHDSDANGDNNDDSEGADNSKQHDSDGQDNSDLKSDGHSDAGGDASSNLDESTRPGGDKNGIIKHLDNNDVSNVKDLCRGNEDAVMSRLTQIPGLNLSPDQLSKFKIWPNATIPFYIDSLSFDKSLRETIRNYLDDAWRKTGLIFYELSDPPEDENTRWVLFINRRGQLTCKHYTTSSFTNTGVQKVIIGYHCLSPTYHYISAIVLALAGVPPQHNAPNRDDYIDVHLDAILPDKKGLFKKLNDDEWLFHDLDYDYESVGHFSAFAFTASGSVTITRKKNPDGVLSFSATTSYSCRDILKIKMLYKPLFTHKLSAKADCNPLLQSRRSRFKGHKFGKIGRH